MAGLAWGIGVDPDELQRTADRFNEMARRGVDDDFRRGVSAYDNYYGDTRLANPNLAAAGNVTASVMGHSYAGPGATIGASMAFAYAAATALSTEVSGRPPEGSLYASSCRTMCLTGLVGMSTVATCTPVHSDPQGRANLPEGDNVVSGHDLRRRSRRALLGTVHRPRAEGRIVLCDRVPVRIPRSKGQLR